MPYSADDPLRNYFPTGQDSAPQAESSNAPLDPAPNIEGDPFSPEALEADGYIVTDPDPQYEDYLWEDNYDDEQGFHARDYRDDPHYPVEDYGSYAENYPEHAKQLNAAAASRAIDRAQNKADNVQGSQEYVLETLRDCLAAMQGASGSELLDLLKYILGSDNVMSYIKDTYLKTYERIAEVLISDYAEDVDRTVDLTDIPGIEVTSGAVQAEVQIISSRVGRDGLPKTPTAQWRALVNYVQRQSARQKALALIAAIDEGQTDADCMEQFRNLEPPSASKTLVNATYARSAKDWEEADLAAAAEAPGFRISSGYPMLDYAFTQKNGRGEDIEPRGSWGPGELHIFAAPTGNGKSAAARRLITSAAEDLVVGWGREHDKVLLAITEEAPKIVYQVAGLGKGQPFHHLADNIVIATIGASRRRLIHAIWDCVVDAFHRSKDTGMPISSCGLPSFVVLDYVGGIVEDGEGADTTAIEKTANLLMRGIAAWDVQMMEEFSGESFAAYAGMSWPTGMDAFQPSVLGFAQFRKLADPQWYDPTNPNASTEDFVIPNADGEDGWEVLPGDFRLPTQSEVRGSGVLINHATSLIIGHRSRPQKNPKIVDEVTGRVRLADDRARWLLVKTRNGSDVPFVEMRFDSIPSGLRGQFFDYRAEKAMERGLLEPTECYQEVGDPILPQRAIRTPFDGISF